MKMYNIPASLLDCTIYCWRKTIIPVCRPGTHALDIHTFAFFVGWQLTTRISGQYSDFSPSACQPPSNFVYRGFYTAHIRKMKWCHQQQAKRFIDVQLD